MKSKNTRILDIIILVPYNNSSGYKEHVTYFIDFSVGEGFAMIDFLANKKLYVLDIVKSHEGTIIC